MPVYKCVLPPCDYATSEPYNYCPLCGSPLHVYEGERWVHQAINLHSSGAKCRMAYYCEPLECYTPECEQLEVSNRCIVSLGYRLEALESGQQRLLKALLAAGLEAPPLSPADLQAVGFRERNKSGPGS